MIAPHELDALRDSQRLAALRRTGLLDSDPELAFDRLTRLAARFLDAPLALVNLVDEQRQFSKSCFAPIGWNAGRSAPLEDSFCAVAVATHQPLVIRDTQRDPRFCFSRMVTEHGVRSYVGVPLTTSSDDALGTLCVADFRPRDWSDGQVESLCELTALVMTEVELRASMRETEEAEHLAAVAERERREKSALLESALQGIFGLDPEGRCTFLNPAGAAMLGYAADEVLGRSLHDLIHHSHPDGSRYDADRCPMHQALRAGTAVHVEDEVLWRRDGSWFPAEYSVAPIVEGTEVRGAVVTFSDVTERRRAAADQDFLSRTSSLLAASALDYSATLRSLPRLAVPALADWSTVSVLDGEGRVQRLETVAADPARREVARALLRHPVELRGDHPIARVLRTGEPLLIPEVTREVLERLVVDDEHRRLLRELGIRSVMTVPLTARGRILGALTLGSATSARQYTPDDLALAQEFAHRSALAVDNARLFHQSQEANRAKAEFLATISHELRTPLNAVMGYAELMRAGIPEPLPAGSREYAERIGLSARHLVQLIDEILTFSRLEAGREQVRPERVLVEELIREISAVVEPLAQEKGLRFRVSSPDEPLALWTDPRKLRQILLNLLDNAVKFTEQGEIEFLVERVDDRIRLAVRDTGIGIASQHRQTVLEPFRQVEQSNTRDVGGTGLGLTVAHRLAQLLGGELTFQSSPGRGSTFSVCLPLGPGSSARGDGEHGQGH